MWVVGAVGENVLLDDCLVKDDDNGCCDGYRPIDGLGPKDGLCIYTPR